MRRDVRFLAVWVAALLTIGTAASAGGAGGGEPRHEVAVGAGSTMGSGAARPAGRPAPTSVPEEPVEHQLPERVPSATIVVPPPAPAPPTTASPSPAPALVPSTTQPVLAEPSVPTPIPTVPVGEIPPAHTQAPYVQVARRPLPYFGADLEVSAPADGGRPGETITVTVRGWWVGARGGSFVVIGPQRFDRPVEEQPRVELGAWSKPCGLDAYSVPVEQVATFEVPLGPGDENHVYRVDAIYERCVPNEGELHRFPIVDVQLAFFSRVARPVAPPSPPLATSG